VTGPAEIRRCHLEGRIAVRHPPLRLEGIAMLWLRREGIIVAI
jgi:hypothetical protein